jgi:hypothetical protein
MKIKKYNDFINEELGWKDAIVGAALGLSTLNPQQSKGQVTPTQQQQIKTTVLSKVKGPVGVENINNPDLDLVHGILGSKRLDDDFEQRVSDELIRLNKLGYKTDVTNIEVKTYVKDGKIITESSCDIVESQNGVSYNIFTTRGSIGYSFEERHDKQIDGLESRLESHYKGDAKKIKTIVISFKIGDETISYKQSFFVASTQSEKIEIVGTDLKDLRTKLISETSGKMVDEKSFEIDIKNLKVTYKEGNTKVTNASLIYDNTGNLNNRLPIIKEKNPTLQIIKQGVENGVEWALVII